ncbi:hypothetical protein DPMN_056701 [Dreissena polymorpha]|uniref:Uncharacterized protein n=1 Tax=Dreissena polymorpha TaxID=45954 RepID=A0A9D4CTY2_DREPO|nr:hypothetical protein DPMN_056701 [Dreissena polymorpha]
MEPCGTPQEMFSDDEKVPDTSTSCFLSDKYDCNHIVISSPRPEARSFIKKCLATFRLKIGTVVFYQENRRGFSELPASF